jgi:hypothetical protein
MSLDARDSAGSGGSSMSPIRSMANPICGGIVAVIVISPMRYAEPRVRSALFALSWIAVALMMMSARMPGSIRSTAVTKPFFACPAASRSWLPMLPNDVGS